MFELRNVTKTFFTHAGATTVIQDLNYTFLPGVSYAIMGPSGTGKSTLLYLMAGLEQATAGSIMFNGHPVVHEETTEYETFLLRSVGLVFQSACLIPELSLRENVGIKGFIAGMSYQQITQRATELLVQVGLEDVIDKPVTVLSGGQQQRVALARALFVMPHYLLLDEPTAHVDAHTAHELLMLLERIKQQHNVGCIVVSHDPAVARAMDKILYLRDGALYDNRTE